MAPIDSPSVTPRVPESRYQQNGGEGTVVCLHGEHDVSTAAALAETMARAIAIVDADLVLDLSDVQFIGAATVQVIIRARRFLRLRSRSLTLRSPSVPVGRVLARSGLGDLVVPRPAGSIERSGTPEALAMRVAVPATEQADGAANVAGCGGP